MIEAHCKFFAILPEKISQHVAEFFSQVAKVDEFWHAGKKAEEIEASMEEEEDFSYQPPASENNDFSEERLSEI